MQYNKRVLANGIRVLTVPMPSLESVTVTVWVKTGSRNETAKNSGISHFLEHMAFKGSKKRPTAKEISEVIDGIGGEFNAGTSKEWTNFFVKCQSTEMETAFDVLSDMVKNPILDPQEIEREKGTIVEEIRMYEDTPMMKIGDVFEGLLYKNSSMGRDIAGTEKTVKSITKDDFLVYRNTYYDTQNIIISVAGGTTVEKVNRLSKKYFGDYEKGTSKKSLNFKPIKLTQQKPQVKLHAKKKEQAHIIIGFLADGKRYRGKFAQTILAAILGGGMSSRLFLEVRERRGLAYAVRTSMDRYTDLGYFGTYAGLDVAKIDEAIKVILDEHFSLAQGHKKVDEKELKKAKEFLKGHVALALEDTRDVSGFFADQELFLPKILTPEEMFKKIEEVKMEDVMFEAKRLFVPEKLNLAIIGPYRDEDRFRKLLK